MGHACQILTFKDGTSKEAIIRRCDEWAVHNMDRMESSRTTLPFPIRFTSKVFNTYAEAEDYLMRTFGNYDEIAVQFKQPKGQIKPTQALLAARKKVQDLTALQVKYKKPHYAGVKSKTISCKACGSSLATAYCGRSYTNLCPVCRADLRPPSTIEQIKSVESRLAAAQKELVKLEREFETKCTQKGYALCWAVACEVHC